MKKIFFVILFILLSNIIYTQKRVIAMENLGNYPMSYRPTVISDSLSCTLSKENPQLGYRAVLVRCFSKRTLEVIDSLILESSKKYTFMRDTVLPSNYFETENPKIPISTYRIFSCGEDSNLNYDFVVIGLENIHILFDDIGTKIRSLQNRDVEHAWWCLERLTEDVEYYIR